MPHWTEQLIERPWSKQHVVSLADSDTYKRAADNGGSDKIRRHDPLSLASGHGRKAGTSEQHDTRSEGTDLNGEEQQSNGVAESSGLVGKMLRTLSNGIGAKVEQQESWEQALQTGSRVISVRDVKEAVPNYKVLHPRAHAFARFVLPVTSNTFADQKWPGKKTEEESGEPEGDEDEKVDEKQSEQDDEARLDPTEETFFHKLVQEMDVHRSFENNDGRPGGELRPLDKTALEQLESTLSVEDQMTPDSWVPRSQRLTRLAGTHPVNAEVEPTELFNAGLITPTKFQYVRSHGPVPQLNWETHRLTVFSDPPHLVAEPKNWTMDELTDENSFRTIELPITFACDGNRRKEMSMTKQTSGISFSASGVSTCLWRGILVRDVLLASGLQDQPEHERWYLNFEGADQCSEGFYATSIPLIHAMDVTNDVLLAFGMNGRVLHPDHGYPLRVIIPGYVGGRQVKWVHKLWITKEPNSSYYHIWDNRRLPPFIETRDHPLAKTFYHHDGTLCNEQILQSVICKPAHNETVPLPQYDNEATYTLQGFAYNGGGTAINRVELTLDDGNTWRYCFKQYVEKPLRHGEKHWAWIFWSCEVPMAELAKAKEVAVRAADARMHEQPRLASWNMLGMMNNSWYRIRPSLTADPKTHQKVLKFKHPVTNKKEDDGWMKPSAAESEPKSANGINGDKEEKTFSLEEIAKHDGKNGNTAWIIIENKVYDVSSVLDWHPGGAAAILTYAGKATVDTTLQYKGIHDNYANSKRDECYIGMLTEEAVKEMEQDAARAAEALAKVKKARKGFTLQPDSFTRAILIKRKVVSKDTRNYQFELPKNTDGSKGTFRLDIGKHVFLSVHFNNQAVLRPYTPIAPVLPEEEDGTFTLCVKTYFPTEGGPFPPGGLISNYLDCMKEGEEIDVRGPVGEIWYKGGSNWEIDGKEYFFDKINLVAGGTGITPHWQLIHAILSDEEDKTCIKMIDCNKSVEDILMRDELQKYADKCPERFQLWHVVSKAPRDKKWKYGEGRLDEDLMRQHFFTPEDGEVVTLLCGPEGLIEHGALPGLKNIGFVKGEDVFGF